MIGLDLLAPEEPQQKIYGMVIGLVTDNKDPKKLGRVKVKYPWLLNDAESKEGAQSFWARIVMPMAGLERGLSLLPEVGDEVLVGFEHGDIHAPYVIGSLWNGVDKPPPEKEKDDDNNLRMFTSRNGNKVIFDDTNGKERIVVQDKLGKNKIVIQDTIMIFNDQAKELKDLTPDKAQLTINAASNPVQITVGKDQDLTLEATGNIILKNADKDFTIECKNFTLNASENVKVEAKTKLDIESDKIALKGKSGMDLKCSSGVKVNSSSLEVS